MGPIRFWLMAFTALIATICWDWPFMLPCKLLIVLVHEIWHGTVALISGAQIEKIELNLQETGETIISGLHSGPGFIFSISMGYIGSALTGAVLLNRGLARRFERITIFFFAFFIFYMSFLFASPEGAAFLTGIGWAIFLLAPLFLGRLISSVTLILLGTLFIWYSLFDMFDFTLNIEATDAGILALFLKNEEFLGVSENSDLTAISQVISIVWCLAIFAIIYLFLRPIARREATPPNDQEEEITPEQFPGDLTPEVQEWFLTRGLGPDGMQLPPELLELQNQKIEIDNVK